MRDLRPFSQLRRDVWTVVSDLLGQRPPSFSRREPLARHLLAPSLPDALLEDGRPLAVSLLAPRQLVVERVVRETRDAVSLYLADPSGAPLVFAPGQFFTVLVELAKGELYRRAYSISSVPGDDDSRRARITIKRVRDGVVSNHLNEHAREGDILTVLGPSGSFTLPPPGERPRRLYLIAGGSGITPLMSIARAALAEEPSMEVSLLYGNRGVADIIFGAELAELALQAPSRFTIRHVLSEPFGDFRATRGILDREMIAAELLALGPLDLLEGAAFYLCGPEPMMIAAREALLERGVAAEQIHEERFSTPEKRSPQKAPSAPEELTLVLRGEEKKVTTKAGQTILEAGLEASLPMPFSCAMGGCGACKGRLVSGTVESEEPNCLSAAERARGFVLTCVSRPTSRVTVEIG